MNLHSGIEELPGLLWAVAGCGAAASGGLLYVLTGTLAVLMSHKRVREQ